MKDGGLAQTLLSLAEEGTGDLVGRLNRVGIPARRGRAKVEELRHLKTPALLQDPSGKWLVTVRAGKTTGEFLTLAGKYRLHWSTVWPEGEGDYIERLDAFPWESGVVTAALLRALARRDLVVPATVIAALLNLVTLWSSWVVANLVDTAQAHGNSVAMGILALVALGVLQAGLTYVRYRLTSTLGQGERYEAGADLMRRVLALPYARIARKNTGEIGYAMESTWAHAELGASLVNAHALDALHGLVGVVVVVLTSPVAGLALLGYAVGVWWIQVASARSRISLVNASAHATTRQLQYLSEALEGAVTIKTHAAEDATIARWFKMVTTEVALDQRSSVRGAFAAAITSALGRIFGLAILLVTAWLVVSGQIGLGGMLLVVQVGMSITVALSGIAETLPMAVMGFGPRLERIRELVCQPLEEPRPQGNRVTAGLVEVENVSFMYPGGKDWVLKDVSFRVEPGGRHWLATPSGSGKTTLLRLLAGLHEPTKGSIAIDGMAPPRIASGLLMLPQAIHLFSGSMMHNLRALSGVEDSDRLKECARQTGLDAFIATLPMGYETPLRASGGDLSGGQRQLVALTAALASDAKVLLLDEAMANLDWSIRPNLAKLRAFDGRTIIYASHDRFF